MSCSHGRKQREFCPDCDKQILNYEYTEDFCGDFDEGYQCAGIIINSPCGCCSFFNDGNFCKYEDIYGILTCLECGVISGNLFKRGFSYNSLYLNPTAKGRKEKTVMVKKCVSCYKNLECKIKVYTGRDYRRILPIVNGINVTVNDLRRKAKEVGLKDAAKFFSGKEIKILN